LLKGKNRLADPAFRLADPAFRLRDPAFGAPKGKNRPPNPDARKVLAERGQLKTDAKQRA
jgi:hypothetical protein